MERGASITILSNPAIQYRTARPTPVRLEPLFCSDRTAFAPFIWSARSSERSKSLLKAGAESIQVERVLKHHLPV